VRVLLREPYIVRRVHSIDDLPALVKIEEASFGSNEDRWSLDDYATDVIAKGGMVYVVGPPNAEPEGSMWLEKEDDALYITSIGVLPRARRKGHARRLIEQAVFVARMNDLKKLALHVRDDNTDAIALYEGMCFTFVDNVPDYYSDGMTARFYEASLDKVHPHRPHLT
jgi:ribosomal-protein-alanine N-acetyltransferase